MNFRPTTLRRRNSSRSEIFKVYSKSPERGLQQPHVRSSARSSSHRHTRPLPRSCNTAVQLSQVDSLQQQQHGLYTAPAVAALATAAGLSALLPLSPDIISHPLVAAQCYNYTELARAALAKLISSGLRAHGMSPTRTRAMRIRKIIRVYTADAEGCPKCTGLTGRPFRLRESIWVAYFSRG